MDQRDTFDAVAALYAEARPGYPDALFDDLWALGGLSRTAEVLEVGCGAGQATAGLAARAGRVLALDPGANLLAEARRVTGSPKVDFRASSFEAFDAPPASFDLVASAQAWHWIDPAVSFPKAARLLRDRGRLAVFGHAPMPPDPSVSELFRRAFDAHAPGAWGAPHPMSAYLPTGPFRRMFEESGLFGEVVHRRYAWTWNMTADQFGKFLRTDSTYHAIPAAQRFALFDELAEAVSKAGGVLHARWETHLYLAEKLGAAPA